MQVRVKLLGIPIGVKAEGGIWTRCCAKWRSSACPRDIPSHIDVDVSELGMHQVVRVSGLPHSDKIKYLTPEDATVLTLYTSARKWLRRRKLWKLRRLHR